MSTHFYLVEALEKERELTNKIVSFNPDLTESTFSTNLTGYRVPQIKTAKQGLTWHSFLYNGFACIIPEFSCIKSGMIISARIGAARETVILTKYSNMYVNKDLGGEGLPFEIEMLPFLPEGYVRKMNKSCYVSSKDEELFNFLHVLIPGGIDALYNHDTATFTIIPVVKLPKETIVTLEDKKNDGSSIERGLNIFRIGEL